MGPILTGNSVEGAQPMWRSELVGGRRSGLPTPYTSTNSDRNDWTIAEIENFIRVSSGAINIANARAHPRGPVNLVSQVFTYKMNTSRGRLLAAPPALSLVCGVILAIWSTILHRRCQIPVMRLVSISQLLKSVQTDYITHFASEDAAQIFRPSQLKRMKVKFGLADGLHIGQLGDHKIAGLDVNAKSFDQV